MGSSLNAIKLSAQNLQLLSHLKDFAVSAAFCGLFYFGIKAAQIWLVTRKKVLKINPEWKIHKALSPYAVKGVAISCALEAMLNFEAWRLPFSLTGALSITFGALAVYLAWLSRKLASNANEIIEDFAEEVGKKLTKRITKTTAELWKPLTEEKWL